MSSRQRVQISFALRKRRSIYRKGSEHPGIQFACAHRLVGLVVKASASRAKDLEFESRLRRDFFSG